jgi:hypothetical protein
VLHERDRIQRAVDTAEAGFLRHPPYPKSGGGVKNVEYHGGPLALPPLHLAAYGDDHARVAALLETGAEPDADASGSQRSPAAVSSAEERKRWVRYP